MSHPWGDRKKHSMRFNSKTGNLIPKLLCIIAGVSLVVFFLFNKKGETPRNVGSIASTDLTALQSERKNKATDKGTHIAYANINSLPFSISKPTPTEGTEEEGLHLYNVNLPLETGSIVDIDLKEPEETDLGLGIFGEDRTLAYSNNTKNGGSEGVRFVITNKKPITIAVETLAVPQTGNFGQYTLTVTTNPEEKGYFIESLPFTTSRPFQGQEKIHIHQTIFTVDKGTIVVATLKSPESAGLALFISNGEGTLNSSIHKGTDEKEAAMTFLNGGKASIIIEAKNNDANLSLESGVESGESGLRTQDSGLKYALSVNTKGVEYVIETLPYAASGYMSKIDAEGENWRWYQIASLVPAGTVITANLSVPEKANMDVTIFVDKDTLSYGASHGIGEKEHAELIIEKDSKVYVIVDNVEGEGNYSLIVTSAIKP